ncbi:MAG: RNA ligase (ATP) [Promethearchaeota archaeon]
MRKLASIQKIKEIKPIENADAIEVATILGWEVVVKKGEFQPGDFCVYFEIDSLLPDEPRYEFLKKSSWNSRYEKIRLKTVKLRGQVSQGLALPLSNFPEINFTTLNEGDDLTETLGIEKYEPIIPASLSGSVNKFIWPIPKTDEERIQSDPEYYLNAIKGKPYYITVKLDGTSASYILCKNENNEIEFHACSRNHSLKYDENNTIWQIAEKYNIERKLKEYFLSTEDMLAIQGEIVGPGIQKNRLNLSEHKLFIFNIINVETGEKFSFDEAWNIFTDILHVPILEEGSNFSYETVDELLELARGKYKDHFETADAKQDREGIVIRSKDQSVSFKVINNDFLLKGGD